MTAAATTTAEALWRFSLALYARPGVPALCLDLQDAHGADVNVVLTLLFAGTRGRRLDDAAVAALDRAVADWREAVVVPLRGVRRHLKIAGGAEELRTAVKRIELEAERAEQVRLAAALGGLPEAVPPAAARASAADNLRLYLQPRGAAEKADAFGEHLAAVVAADARPADLG